MANEITLINGVTKQEKDGTYLFFFPTCIFQAVENADPDAGFYRQYTLNWQEVQKVYFGNITNNLGATDIIGYLEAAAAAGFFFESLNSDVLQSENYILINSISDFPAPISGHINLEANKTYVITTVIDLVGDDLVCGINTVIIGGSSENCRIKSTGLVTALITSNYSLPIRNITIEAEIGLNLSGDGVTTALDWYGVNFECTEVGLIENYSNFVISSCAFLNCGNLTFDGTFGTIAISNSLFTNFRDDTSLYFAASCVITRRFRVIYSSFVIDSAFPSEGIYIDASMSIPDEAYILDTVNFSGGGNYIQGIDSTSNKALFINCVGIMNSATKGFMSMQNNATATTIAVINTYYKALGATVAGDLSKFTHSSNQLTYTGAFSQSFFILVSGSLSAASNNQVCSIAVYKNGTLISGSETTIRTFTAGNPYGFASHIPVSMETNDYIEIFVKNESGTADVTISDIQVSSYKIPN